MATVALTAIATATTASMMSTTCRAFNGDLERRHHRMRRRVFGVTVVKLWMLNELLFESRLVQSDSLRRFDRLDWFTRFFDGLNRVVRDQRIGGWYRFLRVVWR